MFTDPRLNWKMATKGKPRAMRRARTSFTGGIIKKSSEKGSKESVSHIERASKGVVEMPQVSDSEKLGVTILGQCFSDTPMDSVPIKKRKFLLVRSPSPPPHSPCLLNKAEQISGSQSATYNLTTRQLLENNNAIGTVLDEEKPVGVDKTNSEDMDEMLCDNVEFSGVSVLAAAAACCGHVGNVARNDKSSVSEGHSSKKGLSGISEHIKIHILSENRSTQEQVINTAEIPGSKTDIPLVGSSALVSSIEGQGENKMEGYHNSKDSSLLPDLPNKANGNLVRRELSLFNNRSHWDLNTVMDAWEGSYSGVVNSELPDTSFSVEDGIPDARLGVKELCKGKVEPDGTKSAAELPEVVCSLPTDSCERISTVQEKVVFPGKCIVAAHAQDGQQLDGAPVCSTDHKQKPKAANYVRSIGFNADAFCSPIRHVPDLAGGSCLASGCAFDGEKADVSSAGICSAMETKSTPVQMLLSTKSTPVQMLLSRNTSIGQALHVCEPCPAVDQMVSELVSEDKGFKAGLLIPSVACSLSDIQTCEAIQIAWQPGKHSLIHADSETSKTNGPSVGSVPEQVSGMLLDGNIHEKMVADGAMRVHSVQTEPLDERRPNVVSQSKELDKSVWLSEPQVFTLPGLSNCKEIVDGRICSDEVDAAEVEFQSISGLSVQNAGLTEIGCHSHIEMKDLVMPSVVDDLLMDALSCHETNKSYTYDLVSCPVDNALDDQLNCDYDSDASQNDADQAMGMGKVELQGDDDSQYEDGEFRGWELDGSDRETEPVDYGSDNRDIDVFEATSDYPTSTISFNADSDAHKEEEPLEDSHVCPGESDIGKKHKQEPVVTPFPEDSSLTNVLETGSSRNGAVGVMKEVPRGDHSRKKFQSKRSEGLKKDVSEFTAVAKKVEGNREFMAKGDGARHLSHSASLRMKSSRLDHLFEGSGSHGDAVEDVGVDRSKKDHANVSSETLSDESLGRASRSMPRRDLLRIGRPKSSDMSDRKHRSYPQESRSNDHHTHFFKNGGKDAGTGRSIERGGSSLHMHGRRGRALWVNSSSYRARNRNDSPGYYDPTGFTHPGTKDAAAVSTAKLESQGFVVAPDGTVVEAGDVGPAIRPSRQCANASSESSTFHSFTGRQPPTERDEALTLGLGPRREMRPDRRIIGHGGPHKCGPKMVRTRPREIYRGSIHDDHMRSPLQMHHPISRRERSFSPKMRPCVSRSHTRSPSRSRSRPPRVWISPRRRTDNGINNNIRRQSRSPLNFKRSRHRESGFPEHMIGAASRNHASLPHASTCNSKRKDSPDHFGEQEYKRSSGKSPPFYPQSQRFDPMVSPGRLKPEEHYQSMHSGRFHGFRVSTGRKVIGGSDNGRRHGGRYEMLPALKQCDIVDDGKCFEHDRDHGFRAQNVCSRKRRGSPRGFDRGIQNQLGDSSPRSGEEEGHFRYDREGKCNASFKSFGMQECDEGGISWRRRP